MFTMLDQDIYMHVKKKSGVPAGSAAMLGQERASKLKNRCFLAGSVHFSCESISKNLDSAKKVMSGELKFIENSRDILRGTCGVNFRRTLKKCEIQCSAPKLRVCLKLTLRVPLKISREFFNEFEFS